MGNKKISISLKTAHHRAKQMKIWATGMYVTCIFWGHLVHILKWPVTRKWLAIELIGLKFRTWGLLVSE